MRRHRRLPILLSAATLTLGVGLAPTVAAEMPQNPWLEQRVLNMAHSDGEDEAPMNTMYAFRRAVALGSDMLELDVQSTVDGQVVVIHNATLDETTSGTGRLVDATPDEVKELDAVHWFVPGRSAVHGFDPAAYPLREARFGRPKVEGFKPKDFMVPTLREVPKAFPTTPMNIEIKGTNDADTASFTRTGTLPAELLNKNGRTDLIVGSFNDTALADFHARATRHFVERAHRHGYAVHVWFSGSAPDDAATYYAIIDTCADGIMPAEPTLLESIPDERGIERPGQPGVGPCAAA